MKLGTLLFVAAGITLRAQVPETEAQLLRHLDSLAQQQLDKRAAEIDAVRTVAAAEARKRRVHEKIFELIGGLPDYAGPLNARVTGRIEKPRYTIEKVVFESLPHYYVTADVFRPNAPGRYPAVLIPLGHWDQGKIAEQRTAANLAMKGFVALAYDEVGQGERIQAYDRRIGGTLGGWSTEEHLQVGAQSLLVGDSVARYFIWDAKRAIDYLVSRPDVDADRIGCTGCSGGGTVTTYISALDARIKAAAPACWMNSYRALFAGPVGDSEQSLPSFISSGLDQTDYAELFAPKPWLIVSTEEDFFPIEGVRRIFEEARRWYKVYGAEERLGWVVGPGPHGTPQPVRERIYDWMIRWLKDGKGDYREEPVEMLPDHELIVTESGQVGGRELYEVIKERFAARRSAASSDAVLDLVRGVVGNAGEKAPESRVVAETRSADSIRQTLLLETEPGLELHATLLVPRTEGAKPAVLTVETGDAPSATALEAARLGAVVLALAPRGLPRKDDDRPFGGEFVMSTRALLIGRNLAGLRAYDLRRGLDFLAARPEVDRTRLYAAAAREPGVWLLYAAVGDPRFRGIWLDKTPYSFTAALDEPLNRNLYSALIPGFCLHGDLTNLVQAVGLRKVLWTDPTNWMGVVTTLGSDYRYRTFRDTEEPWLRELMSLH